MVVLKWAKLFCCYFFVILPGNRNIVYQFHQSHTFHQSLIDSPLMPLLSNSPVCGAVALSERQVPSKTSLLIGQDSVGSNQPENHLFSSSSDTKFYSSREIATQPWANWVCCSNCGRSSTQPNCYLCISIYTLHTNEVWKSLYFCSFSQSSSSFTSTITVYSSAQARRPF